MEKKDINELKDKYNISSDEVIIRLNSVKEMIKTIKKKDLNYEELIGFLEATMGYDDIQLWIIRKKFEGVTLTLTDKLEKLFELKKDEDIVRLYDTIENVDDININAVRKIFTK